MDPALENFQRLIALSARALDAVEMGDADELERVLAERSELIAVTDVRELAAVKGGEQDASAVAQVGALLREARKLDDADKRLGLAIAAKRDEIERHLEAFETGGAARSAYNPESKTRGTINVVR